MGLIRLAKAVAKRLIFWRYRSAQTGRYVSRDYAERHPDVTVKERP